MAPSVTPEHSLSNWRLWLAHRLLPAPRPRASEGQGPGRGCESTFLISSQVLLQLQLLLLLLHCISKTTALKWRLLKRGYWKPHMSESHSCRFWFSWCGFGHRWLYSREGCKPFCCNQLRSTPHRTTSQGCGWVQSRLQFQGWPSWFQPSASQW